LRLSDLAVGGDNRNRALMSMFRSKTGRNQPSNAKFVFGLSSWLRGLIKPAPGHGLAYVDWSQQEFGIAAALSGDEKMRDAYLSGDPYMAFARQAGAVPAGATKASHGAEREQFKACVLAVQYGMQEESLARRIQRPPVYARELLRMHRRTYRRFWEWSDGVRDYALANRRLWTVFGWVLHVDDKSNSRSLCNFPMQANGSEMLRLACCLATEAGIRVVAPVHDAVLIEAPLAELEARTAQMQALMRRASSIVLGGFELRSDAKLVEAPDRFCDERGSVMWDLVQELLQQAGRGVTP
jgi:DNA polymerase-1